MESHQRKRVIVFKQEIKKLSDEGLIDNKRFAEQYIHSRSNRGYGPLRIRQELVQKGVDDTICQSLIGSKDWNNLAKLALEKKTGKKRETRIGASLWFIMIGFLVYCIWSLGFKAIILILIYSATSFTCIYMFTKFFGFKSENFK